MRRWQITIDWPALSRVLLVVCWVVWRMARAVALTAVFAVGVLSVFGYTPATAPDIHLLLSSIAIHAVQRAIAQVKARR
jgi:uncharacterized membrane protein YesL